MLYYTTMRKEEVTIGQSDGRGTLKNGLLDKLDRISLRLKTDKGDRWYNFQVNPENYEESHPQRTTTFKTREAVVVEDFGPDLGTITFSGTTGFRRVNGRNGAERLYELKNLIEEYGLSGFTTEPGGNPNNAELIFYNRTEGESWYVHLDNDGFIINRSAEESLLHRYTISLIILRRASKPDYREVTNPKIGNPLPTNNYKTSTDNVNSVINPRNNESIYESASKGTQHTIGTSTDPNGPSIKLD